MTSIDSGQTSTSSTGRAAAKKLGATMYTAPPIAPSAASTFQFKHIFSMFMNASKDLSFGSTSASR
jgi:hypothetical protein